ncbi:hypothetical protein [Corynebacterium oculi]|uniref:Cupin domain protein n=1 Tax=Corynebacterium oculi TaxID=1544416 RepID=A0A0Q0YMY2_9CORY|nr:hypothetical protein [Corynebacterium oculi]KQB83848.1 hypothetical protein Cocul_01921 [Corynebacterium oculi]
MTGDGWDYIEGLAESHLVVEESGAGSAKPKVQVLARLEGVTMVRLAFRAGDVMAEHSAGTPIVIMGQKGAVNVTIGDKSVTVTAGSALHIAERRIHALAAQEPAIVTLLILTGAKNS